MGAWSKVGQFPEKQSPEGNQLQRLVGVSNVVETSVKITLTQLLWGLENGRNGRVQCWLLKNQAKATSMYPYP